MTRDIVISLTTIPPRMPLIMPTLETLLAQTAPVSEIRLNLCRSYRRFDFDPADVPSYPEGVTVHWSDVDYGPATKILPTLRDHKGRDTEIIFCDDDQLYAPNWVQKFIDARNDHPDVVLAQSGYDLYTRPSGWRYFLTDQRGPRYQPVIKDWRYRAVRALSLLQYRPNRFSAPGYIDVLEGFGGVMLRADMMPEAAFDIPENVWMVDDPWLSGHLEQNGVPIWLIHDGHKMNYDKPTPAHRTHRLLHFVHEGADRLVSDTQCIDYMRETYGIWPGKRERDAA